jgi:hypothetical protein
MSLQNKCYSGLSVIVLTGIRLIVILVIVGVCLGMLIVNVSDTLMLNVSILSIIILSVNMVSKLTAVMN